MHPLPERNTSPEQTAHPNKQRRRFRRWLGATTISQGFEVDRASFELAERFERQRFIKEAPRMADILSDDSTPRNNRLSYWIDSESTRMRHIKSKLSGPQSETTEQAAILELYNFLSQAANAAQAPADDFNPAMAAKRLQEGLHFIGAHEMEEATEGIAALWKKYLAQNPKNQIVVPRLLNRDENSRKSADYIFDKVIAHFTEEERGQYGVRISQNLDAMKPRRDPTTTKVVFLDDWAISGTQESSAYSRLTESRIFNKAHLERHYVAASDAQLNEQKIYRRDVPLYAYFRVPESNSRGAPLVTGAHSSVDFGFTDEIERIAESHYSTRDRPLPALANIKKPY